MERFHREDGQIDSDERGTKPDRMGLLDLIDDAVLVTDPSAHRVIDANHRAIDLTGMSIEEMRNRSAIEVLASSPLGAFDGLEPMLSDGEGSFSAPEEGRPFLFRSTHVRSSKGTRG